MLANRMTFRPRSVWGVSQAGLRWHRKHRARPGICPTRAESITMTINHNQSGQRDKALSRVWTQPSAAPLNVIACFCHVGKTAATPPDRRSAGGGRGRARTRIACLDWRWRDKLLCQPCAMRHLSRHAASHLKMLAGRSSPRFQHCAQQPRGPPTL